MPQLALATFSCVLYPMVGVKVFVLQGWRNATQGSLEEYKANHQRCRLPLLVSNLRSHFCLAAGVKTDSFLGDLWVVVLKPVMSCKTLMK